MALLSLDGRPVPEDLARAMLRSIAHRGDRKPRLWMNREVALGHVNFPTTYEAERELLPSSDESDRYWITWDGRLDNREELIPKLALDRDLGRVLTDADFVLRAYRKWGEECVHHLLGDWAIVIWDAQEHRLFCAKDPLGWRQLYYAEHQGLLAVGSEPRQLLAGSWLPRVLNEDYAVRFLAAALQDEDSLHYREVVPIHGGRTLAAQAGILTKRTYWEYPRRNPRHHLQARTYLEEFEATFDHSLRARMRSNRPVATMLSGGVDSSYVSLVASEVAPGTRSYSIYVPGSRGIDEREYADDLVEHSSLVPTYLDVSDAWALSRKWLPDEAFDQPPLPGGGTALRALAASVKANGHTVLLGGEGGDEWFDGGTFATSRFRCLSDAVLHGRLRLAWRLAGEDPTHRPRAIKLGMALADDVLPAGLGRRLVKQAYIRPSELVTRDREWVSIRERRPSSTLNPRASQSHVWRMYRQIMGYEAPWRDRHVFLGNGLESRSPFHDLRVVELMANTPDWVKQFTGRRRAFLRDRLARRGATKVAERRSKGVFNELLIHGLAGDERERFLSGIEAAKQLRQLDAGLVDRRVSEWLDAPNIHVQSLYDVAVTGLWLRSTCSGTDASEFRDQPLRKEVIVV